MARIIPRKTRVKIELFKNITVADIIIGGIGVAIAVLIFVSYFGVPLLNLWIGIAWLAVVVSLYFPIADDARFYSTIGYLFRYFAQKKKYRRFKEDEKRKRGWGDISDIIPFEKIDEGRFINLREYYAQVIEITPIEFSLLNEYKQEMLIQTFANAIRRITSTQTCTITKISKAMILDGYVYNEDKKYNDLLELQYEGEISQEEVDIRSGVFEERVSSMENINRMEKVYKDYFYIIVYDKDKEALENTTNGIQNTLMNSVTSITTRKLSESTELAAFIRANYGKEFDERDLEGIPLQKHANWAMPDELRFQAGRIMVNGKPYRQFVISDYPLSVLNAWGAPFFLLDRTRVAMKIKPVDKYQSEKTIDKAIMEMESKVSKFMASSKQIENQTHLETLKALLISLKNNNESLYEVNTFITCEESVRKEIRAILRQEGFKSSELFARQIDGFISSNLSMRDIIKETKRNIPTTTLAAVFPFISGALQDPKGIYIGDNEYPVFVDFFKRDRERVNSNMMVIGKSGSGKSFATKTLLANFAADNTKVFILDPENEYTNLAFNLKGKVIDVGSSAMGIINPFHVVTTLKADTIEIVDPNETEEERLKREAEEVDDSFSLHLQFLEQFFKTILVGISPDAFELLNSAVVDVYKKKGITNRTKLNKLTAKDYPIFDDLYEYVQNRIKNETNSYHKTNWLTIETYIKKFASGGRNSALWNGPTSIQTKENFICFNFQSLLGNNNQLIANAQMLIIFRYLNNEIIKNKDFNEKYKVNRKIIVAVDEAHVFINPNYPIALDFMAQMAKRIRKYGGMQVVITQNIKDFVGTAEIQRQSTAVINASQYSMIFSLAPSDLNDLVELYRKSGEINQEEQNSIVTAGVGDCFFITGPMSRTMVHINPFNFVKKIFTEKL